MPTLKTRINLTVPLHINKTLIKLSRRDRLPVATKTLQLLTIALELEEDISLATLAEQRDTEQTKWLSHTEIWK